MAAEPAAAARTLFGAAAIALLVVGAPVVVFPGRSADWLGWTTASPLAASVVGSLLWAMAAAVVVAALAPRWVDARLVVAPLAVVGLAPLLATLLESDARHDDWTGWVWLAVVTALPIVAVVVALQHRGASAGRTRHERPSPAFSVAVSLQAAALIGVGGVALLDPDRGAQLWPWTSSAMDARTIGALVLALGAAAAAATMESEQRRVRSLGVLFAIAVVLLGVAVGRDVDAVDWSRPMTIVVVAFVASLAATAAWAITAGDALEVEEKPGPEPVTTAVPAAEAPTAPVAATKAPKAPDAPAVEEPKQGKKQKKAAGMRERQVKRKVLADVKNGVRGKLFR